MNFTRPFIVVLFAFVSFGLAAAQPPISRDLSRCVDVLKIPRFGIGAYSAGNSAGPVVALINILAGGKLGKIDVNGGKPGHRDEVREYVQRSSYRPTCAGALLEIQFTFRIEGEPLYAPFMWMEFKAPNHFVIYTRPIKPSVN